MISDPTCKWVQNYSIKASFPFFLALWQTTTWLAVPLVCFLAKSKNNFSAKLQNGPWHLCYLRRNHSLLSPFAQNHRCSALVQFILLVPRGKTTLSVHRPNLYRTNNKNSQAKRYILSFPQYTLENSSSVIRTQERETVPNQPNNHSCEWGSRDREKTAPKYQ